MPSGHEYTGKYKISLESVSDSMCRVDVNCEFSVLLDALHRKETR